MIPSIIIAMEPASMHTTLENIDPNHDIYKEHVTNHPTAQPHDTMSLRKIYAIEKALHENIENHQHSEKVANHGTPVAEIAIESDQLNSDLVAKHASSKKNVSQSLNDLPDVSTENKSNNKTRSISFSDEKNLYAPVKQNELFPETIATNVFEKENKIQTRLTNKSFMNKGNHTINSYDSNNFTSHFTTFINKSLFTLCKQKLLISSSEPFFDGTFIEVLTVTMLDAIFNFDSQLKTIPNHNFDNFKMQIQYLAEQIKKYNNISVYKNLDEMLLLIQCINQFLKENNVIHLSQAMSMKLNDVLKTATTCCNIIKNQNIILASKNASEKVISFFEPIIDTTHKLTNFSDSYGTMHKIYDAHSNMDNIMQGWKKFQSNRLYKNRINREYAAFTTFLLLFENSIIAAAIILDETSSLYKVINPVSVTMNIA